ncbi:hypothetical protein [Vreelandella populi]|uniref:hypothetical protein n=1 Tax=Vreelandella populi TaxID=2498858 RepID=UPI000F8D9110|nr:hypothetical protein [Halomonas populi]RUR56359.1 hypothetical protein ELY40_04160 [Halomonas populi]
MSVNWGSVADWVSGIGSLAAVVTALYLARASNKIRLRVHVGHRIVLAAGQQAEPPQFLQIGAVNIGSRFARITNVGYRVGVRRKQFAIQSIEANSMSSGMPADLSDGQEARWMIPLDLSDNWIERFARDFLLPNWKIRLWSARVQVHTSVGRVFEASFEPSIKKKLAAECARQVAAGG